MNIYMHNIIYNTPIYSFLLFSKYITFFINIYIHIYLYLYVDLQSYTHKHTHISVDFKGNKFESEQGGVYGSA